jgi:hypothetical protein
MFMAQQQERLEMRKVKAGSMERERPHGSNRV